jgi:hypothetical protein
MTRQRYEPVWTGIKMARAIEAKSANRNTFILNNILGNKWKLRDHLYVL